MNHFRKNQIFDFFFEFCQKKTISEEGIFVEAAKFPLIFFKNTQRKPFTHPIILLPMPANYIESLSNIEPDIAEKKQKMFRFFVFFFAFF
jgi:hypothetical protein